MTQQFSNTNYVENPVSECVCTKKLLPLSSLPDAGTLQSLKDRFARWGECNCPEELLEEVHPHGCPNVTIVSCVICKKENRRFYS